MSALFFALRRTRSWSALGGQKQNVNLESPLFLPFPS
jgi:hypothetical protein